MRHRPQAGGRLPAGVYPGNCPPHRCCPRWAKFFSEHLRRLNVPRAEVARRMGIDASYVSWMANYGLRPHTRRCPEIARVLGCTLAEVYLYAAGAPEEVLEAVSAPQEPLAEFEPSLRKIIADWSRMTKHEQHKLATFLRDIKAGQKHG